MEALVLLVLVVIVLCLVLPVVAMAKAGAARRSVEELTARVARLEKRGLGPEPVAEPMSAGREQAPVGEGVAFPGKVARSPTEEKATPLPRVPAASIPPPLPTTAQ